MSHFSKPAGDSFLLDFSAVLNIEPVGAQVVSSIARFRGATPVAAKQSAAVTGGSDDEISLLIDGNTISGTVNYDPEDTRSLIGDFVWDIVLKTADGDEVTIDDGTVFFNRRVTRTVE